MFIYYLLLKRLASYKVRLCFIVLSVTVGTLGYVCSFCEDQIPWILLDFMHDNL